MRRLAPLVLASCVGAGALGAGIDSAHEIARAAALGEANLTLICTTAIGQQCDDASCELDAESRIRAILAQCEHAYNLYDVLANDMDALLAALEAAKAAEATGQDYDEAELMRLMLKAGASRRAFEAAIRKIGA